MNLTSGTHTHTHRRTHTKRESVIVSQCVFVFAEQRTTTGWQIVLLAANAFGSAIKSIYCPLKAPLPKSPCHPSVRPSVHSSVHPAVPSSCVPPLVGEAWGFCVCKIAKLLPQPHAARTIYLIHIQISDNARNSPAPPSLSHSGWLLSSRCGDCPLLHWQHLFAVQIYFYWIAKNWQPSSGGKSRAPFTSHARCSAGTRLPIVQIVETLCKFLYCFSLYLPPSLALFSLLFAFGSFVCSRGGRQKDRRTDRSRDR